MSRNQELLATASFSSVHVHSLKLFFDLPSKVFRLSTDTFLEEQEDDDIILSIALDSQEGNVFVSTRSLQVHQFDFATQVLKKSWKAHEAGVLCMEVIFSGKYLVTGSADGTLKIWHTDSLTLERTLKGHSSVIRCLCVTADDALLFSGAEDGNIRMWDLKKMVCLAIFKGAHTSAVTGLSISPCGGFLVSVGRDGVAATWDISAKTLDKMMHLEETLESVVAIPLQNSLWGFLTGGSGGKVKLWSPVNAKCLRSYSGCGSTGSIIKYIYPIQDGQQFLVADSDHILSVFDVSGTRIRDIVGFNQEITDVCFLSNSVVAVSSNSPILRLYDLSNGHSALFEGHVEMILNLSATSLVLGENFTVFLVSASKDKTAIIWRFNPTARLLSDALLKVAKLDGHAQSLSGVSLCQLVPESIAYVATVSQDHTLKVWAPDSHNRWASKFTVKAHDRDINAVACSRDLIVTVSQDKTGKVWDPNTSLLLGTLTGHKRALWSASILPVGIFTGSADKTIRLWSISSFQCIRKFEGHSDSVLKLSPLFSPSMDLLSSGADGLVKIWSVQTAECEATLDGHSDKVWAIAVSPFDLSVISGGGDSQLVVWDNCTQQVIEEDMQKKADSILQEQEFINRISKHDFQGAFALAFTMKQPYRLLSIFSEVLEAKSRSSVYFFEEKIDAILGTLSVEELSTLVVFLCDWNTQFRNYLVCHNILALLFKNYSSDRLLSTPGIKVALKGIASHSERHYGLLDKGLIDFRLIDLFLHDTCL